jgi:hypothetical protein
MTLFYDTILYHILFVGSIFARSQITTLIDGRCVGNDEFVQVGLARLYISLHWCFRF